MATDWGFPWSATSNFVLLWRTETPSSSSSKWNSSDPASLPESPTEPNRLIIATIGTGIGFVVGVFLAGARELKDASLKNLKDVRAYTNLAVLSSIPLLENALLVRRKRRLFWLAWTSTVIIGTIAMSGSMYYYYFGRT